MTLSDIWSSLYWNKVLFKGREDRYDDLMPESGWELVALKSDSDYGHLFIILIGQVGVYSEELIE